MGTLGSFSLAALLSLTAGCSYRNYSSSSLANAKQELSKGYMGKINEYIGEKRKSRKSELEGIAADLVLSSDTPEMQEAFYLADESVRGILQQETPQIIPNNEITYLSRNFSDKGVRFSRAPLGFQSQEQHLSVKTFNDAQLTTSILIGAFSTFDGQEDVSMYTLWGKEKDKCGGYQLYVVGPSDVAHTSFSSNRFRYPWISNWFVTQAKNREVILTLNSLETSGNRKAFDSMEIFQRAYHMGVEFKITEPIDIASDLVERIAQSPESPMRYSTIKTIGLDKKSEALYTSFVSTLEDHPNLIYICDYQLNNQSVMIIAAGNCSSGVRPLFFSNQRSDQITIKETDHGTPVNLPVIGRPDTALTNLRDKSR